MRDGLISRRTVLRVCAAALGASALDAPCKAITMNNELRPFNWKDAESRVEIQSACLSPRRDAFAIQVIRPLSARGVYAGEVRPEIQSRAELWLLDAQLQRPRSLSLGDLWVWAPVFSPGGSRLAALTADGRGKVGLAVWEMGSLRSSAFLELNVDLYVKFSAGGVVSREVAGLGSAWMQFAWLSEEEILFVCHGEDLAQFEQAISSEAVTYPRLRRRSAKGDLSVRVWNEAAPTCGSQRSLSVLNCANGKVRPVFNADVRGVALSPDGKSVAALVADGRIRLPPEKAAEPWLSPSSVGDDPLVSMALVLLDLEGGRAPRYLKEFRSVGNVAPRRLPRWSSDGTTLAVPARGDYSSGAASEEDACWEVDVGSWEGKRRPTASALDSELLAGLMSSFKGSTRTSLIQERPQPTTPRDDSQPTLGIIEGAVFQCGDGSVVYWRRPSIIWMRHGGARTVEGEFGDVQPPMFTGRDWRMLATRANGDRCVIVFGLSKAEVLRTDARADWIYLSMGAAGTDVVFKCDTDVGSNIYGTRTGTRTLTSALSFNTHFRNVARAECREIRGRLADGEEQKGLLQLPVGWMHGDRHPVVVLAYPGYVPSLNSSITKVNSPASTLYPFQYLLTCGFAVFCAPLPVRAGQSTEPLTWVTDAVLPWLDILDRQPDIAAGQYGFFEHSNGGYVGLALEAGSSRFKAIAVSSTFPDLAASTLSGSMDTVALDCGGQVLQADRFYFESASQPFGLGNSFWKDSQKFIRNSPLYHLEKATTPLLLIEGEFDYSPRQMEAVFSVLYGRGVPVEMAYYWGEGHVISGPGNIQDVWRRTEQFFRKYLDVP